MKLRIRRSNICLRYAPEERLERMGETKVKAEKKDKKNIQKNVARISENIC